MPNEIATLEVDVDELTANSEALKEEAELKLTGLIAQHRTLAERKREIEAEISPVKASISEIISVHGNYKDEDGYARISIRKAGVSYTSAEVEKLASVWSESEDHIMRMCGNLLKQHRKVTEERTITYIK